MYKKVCDKCGVVISDNAGLDLRVAGGYAEGLFSTRMGLDIALCPEHSKDFAKFMNRKELENLEKVAKDMNWGK